MNRVSLSAKVYERLRQQIIVGELRARQPLDLGEIAAAFGVSRMPVRDAINRLATEGLVEVRPRSGTRVSARGIDEASERRQVRYLLEPGIVEAVTLEASDAFVQDLERLQEELEQIDPWQVYHDYDLQRRYRTLHDQFHLRILEETKSIHVQNMVGPYISGSAITPSFFGSSYTGPVFRMAEHRVILEAIRRRDARGAAEAMRIHLRNGWDDIANFLKQT